MGHSKAAKAGSHQRIVEKAAALFRENGVDRVGVADLMKQSGLTHGGFYRHFASRDDLVAEAIERALEDGGKKLRLHGYFLVTLLGRTEHWLRAE